MRFLAFGEAMLEISGNTKSFAGDVINFLKAAELQGAEAYFFSQLGSDAAAENLREFLKAENIHLAKELFVDAKTGQYTIHLNNGERSFTYDRRGSAAALIQPESVTDDLVQDVDLVYLSGISLALSESAKKTGYELIGLAKENNIRLAYDLNFRANMQDKESAAKNLAKLIDELCFCFISGDEVELAKQALNMPKADDEDLLRLIRDEYFCEAVIKRGAQGAYALDENDEFIKSESVEADVVDTSGAGDVFNGVYLYERMSDTKIQNALQAASVFAARHIEKAGAFPRG